MNISSMRWDRWKLMVMFRSLAVKFSREDMRKQLLATGDAILVEHTSNDSQWADGGDGSGTNYLGKLLMKLR